MRTKNLIMIVCCAISIAGCAESGKQDQAADGTSRVDSILGSDEVVPQNVTPPATDGVALNPPHGEPGHRCEIAVGAPLNSQAASSSEPSFTITPQPELTAQPVAQPTESPAEMLAKGLNPPHGSEGHDCAIAVGAPLKK